MSVKDKIYEQLLSGVFTFYDDSIMELTLQELIKVYNPKTIKIKSFKAENISFLGKSCDFSFLEDFHDTHAAGIDGYRINIYKKDMNKPILTLYVCNSCLDELTIDDLLTRLEDFKGHFIT